ncbi:hypothetical protein D0C16_20180 [Cellvibrio sp. KY-GH-1]|uniref:hypothetical protein n=1 Tax=Cellvibrio sp. KY-GH-1 TaxID=2303332 RepID=UPI0012484C39|nr:hypothetical protein [Cellvibrio sp. KY-GH-1]QEY18099.1 hypothetical protein D0C16_20180 [Cellvibrio sp. KY-GH-1]
MQNFQQTSFLHQLYIVNSSVQFEPLVTSIPWRAIAVVVVVLEVALVVMVMVMVMVMVARMEHQAPKYNFAQACKLFPNNSPYLSLHMTHIVDRHRQHLSAAHKKQPLRAINNSRPLKAMMSTNHIFYNAIPS